MSSDLLIETQLAHNAWATGRIIEQCESLTPEQFTQEMDIGPGSVQATLSHVIEAMFYFADTFHAREYHRRDRFEERSRTPAGLLDLLTRVEPELAASIRSWLAGHSVADPIAWPGVDGSISGAAALAQVFDHGSHHRAQVLNMLRRLGGLGGLEVYPLVWSAESGHEIA